MQAVDLSRLSLEQFSAISGKASERNTRRKARTDITDALRTVYWVRGIAIRTGIKSSRGLEKHFEPESFWKSTSNDVLRKNKLSKYRYGKHLPSPELVKRVESVLPGQSWQLNHPLWELLASDTINIDTMLRKLDTPLRDRLFRNKSVSNAKRPPDPPIDRILANALLRHASLDSLAAVILLFKKPLQEENGEAALAWSNQIYRQLVVLGFHFTEHAIAQSLFDLIERRIFSPNPIDGQRYFFPANFYRPAISKLLDTMYHLQGLPYTKMSPKDKNIQMSRILNGNYGWDFKFAFNPFHTDSKSSPNSQERGLWLFTWAWNMLHSGGHRNLPPGPVLNGTDLFARNSTPLL